MLSHRQLTLACCSIHYYTVILSLFQPHVDSEPDETAEPDITSTPSNIVLEAKARLETLMRLYYLRHSYETYDPMMTYFLSVFAFLSIDALKATASSSRTPSREDTDAIYSSIILAFKGLYDQSKLSHLAHTLTKIVRNGIDSAQTDLLRHMTGADEPADGNGKDKTMLQYLNSSLPVSIVSSADDVEKKRVDHLIKELVGVQLEEDATVVDGK